MPNCIRKGHLLFGFLVPGEIIAFKTLREDQKNGKIMDHDSDLLDAGWYHEGFFQTTAGVRSDRGRLIVELFGSFD